MEYSITNHMLNASQVVAHCDWLITLKCSAVEGKGISPDNRSELAIHVVMVISTVVLSVTARLNATSPSPSLNLLIMCIILVYRKQVISYGRYSTRARSLEGSWYLL